MKSRIYISGKIRLICRDKNGKKRWDTGWITNGITSAGLAQLASLAGDASAVPFTYLALGTSNTAFSASQTALGAEISTNGLSRAAATISRVTTTVTNDTWQAVYTWTASGSSTVEEIGVFNASSSGTMLARALTSSKTMVNTDTLQATYQVKFS